jgi:hypothetical protein
MKYVTNRKAGTRPRSTFSRSRMKPTTSTIVTRTAPRRAREAALRIVMRPSLGSEGWQVNRRPNMLGRLLLLGIGGLVAWKCRDEIRDYVNGNAGPISSRLENSRGRIRAGAPETGRGVPTE